MCHNLFLLWSKKPTSHACMLMRQAVFSPIVSRSNPYLLSIKSFSRHSLILSITIIELFFSKFYPPYILLTFILIPPVFTFVLSCVHTATSYASVNQELYMKNEDVLPSLNFLLITNFPEFLGGIFTKENFVIRRPSTCLCKFNMQNIPAFQSRHQQKLNHFRIC